MARGQGNRNREDGRRQLLVYLDPDLIKCLKRVALDEEIHVYEIVEEAARDWLRRKEERFDPVEADKLT